MPIPETQERKPIPAHKTKTRRDNIAAQTNRNVVILHGVETDLTSNEGIEFTRDCVRAAENLHSDDDLKAKWELTDDDWIGIVQNKALIKAIKLERARRVRSGIAAKELAAKHHATSPNILNEIATGKSNDRHKIEAIKELRACATGGEGAEGTANAGATFVIRIDLSATPGGEVIELKSEKQPLTPIDTGWREVE